MKRTLVVLLFLLVAIGLMAIEIGGETSAEVIYNGDPAGMFEIDQKVDIDIDNLHLDIDGGTDYKIDLQEWVWDYAIAGKYTWNILIFGGKITGKKDLNLNEIFGHVGVAYENVGADFHVQLSADEDLDPFQGFDVSAFWNVGPLSLKGGYLFTENGKPDKGAPSLPTNGGVYAKAKITY
jgi:hypothetical protein